MVALGSVVRLYRSRLMGSSGLGLPLLAVHLLGVPLPVLAQSRPGPAATPAQASETSGNPAPAASPQAADDIVVTASRREETVTKLPFNISAYGSQQLARANITSVAALTQQVPNFIIEDRGARGIASSIPVIRGINASVAAVAAARYFQNPVGFYLGNAPITGGFPLFDVERVEVLRGPQGTLYGAGALSGAVRIVPAEPRFDKVDGFATASIGDVAHSGQASYILGGAVNLPLSDELALRVTGRYERSAGFIDQKSILRRDGDDYEGGLPILAEPGNLVGSRAVYFNKDDVDEAKTTSFRAALRWEPTDALKVLASYDHAYAKGTGSPVDNNSFEGGASPIDPRITLEATGDYERTLGTLEPFNRKSRLAALDASYDLGFATVSTTLAFGRTDGWTLADSTQNLLGSPYGFYYTGSPANPRAVIPVTNTDRDRSFTEEVRLVSSGGGNFDYILGAFFQQQRRDIGLKVWDPGADTFSAAANGGSRLPIAAGGTYVVLYPDNSAYNQETRQRFNDYSLYGELSWHLTPDWQVTGGARVFHQTFDADLVQQSSFFFFDLASGSSAKVTSQIFKANTSYTFTPGNQLYATFSQGFRRGGANAFPTEGVVLEPTQLLTYVPDRTNNFEIGAKGRLGGITYAIDGFYIDWRNPQIDITTPFNLTPVVINADKASSKGVELELSGPLFAQGLSFNAGVAYAKARLTEDFSLPAGAGGAVVSDAIRGRDGDRLPGAPDFSASGTLNYKADHGTRLSMTYSAGVDYRSSTVNQIASLSGNAPTRSAPGYALLRASISGRSGPWTVDLFGTNLADRRTLLSQNFRSLSSYRQLGNFGNAFAVARPREVGLRLTRAF